MIFDILKMVLNRLTQRAKRVILRALERGETISSRHFLLALSSEKEGLGAEVLEKLDFSPEEKEVSLPRVLEAAFDEAGKLSSPYVGTEHLLLGFTRMAAPQSFEKVKKEVQSAVHYPQAIFSAQGRTKTPLLSIFGRDLTQLAERGELSPLVGREEELSQIIRILLRREKNSPLLIGDPGVGKTALIHGLAQRIVSSQVPKALLSTRIISFNFPSFLSLLPKRQHLEATFNSLLSEAQASKVILFIDNLHTIMGRGAALKVSSGLVNVLKDSLSQGKLRVVGETTPEDYKKHLAFDKGLTHYFQSVRVEEPSEEETLNILQKLAPRLEKFHQVSFDPRALRAAVYLSRRHISEGALPDKALGVLDEAAALGRMRAEEPSSIGKVQRGLSRARKKLGQALGRRDLDRALELRVKERELREKAKKLEKEERGRKVKVGADLMAEVVSKRTGVPLAKLTREEEKRLLNMEDFLKRRIVGQDHAVSVLARAIRRAQAGIRDPRRPIGSFLFLGPTGVGKTELAKTLAQFLFGAQNRVIQFDMSEFRERHETARLIGAPPGYVGYGKGGELTEAVRARPYSVILFDEIDKAHPEVLNLLLQIMEEGSLRDGQGERADFSNTVVIMTSNVGAHLIRKEALGFAREEKEREAYEKMKERLLSNLKKKLRPEFLNRLSEIMVFRSLSPEDVLKIVDLQFGELKERLGEQHIEISLTPEARKILAQKGYSEEYGARPLLRTIEHLVEDPLSEMIIEGKVKEGDKVKVRARGGELVFD